MCCESRSYCIVFEPVTAHMSNSSRRSFPRSYALLPVLAALLLGGCSFAPGMYVGKSLFDDAAKPGSDFLISAARLGKVFKTPPIAGCEPSLRT
jgi:hypothetical protein